MTEKLQRAIRSGGGSTILQGILGELVDYTCYHFKHEEELMQRIGYPHYQNHRRQHDDLRCEVHAMRVGWAAGQTNLENEIMNFLADWLRCRTTTSDRRIGTYMRKCGLVP